MLFFAHFQILRKSPPSFVPDYSHPNAGQYGNRQWYNLYVFPSATSEGDEPMTYNSKPPLPYH